MLSGVCNPNALLAICTNLNKQTSLLQLHSRYKSLKACIVGAGPAGYYTAQKLLKGNSSISVDIIDKLPIPFGLVRFGVAPDHPEVKNVINTFTQTATKNTDRCRFVGNVEVGKDIDISILKRLYNIVVLSFGAESDRHLNIEGENSRGVYSAREFVGWYNGLPEYSQLSPDLSHESIVIVGQGNVALDIARLLLMPIDQLSKTDICEHALNTIASSKVKKVYIVGRRGPLQTAFTIKEFRELTKLPGVVGEVSAKDVSHIDVTALPRPRKRLTELMVKMATSDEVQDTLSKTWFLKFLMSPTEIVSKNGVTTGVNFVHNRLEGSDIDTQNAVPTDELSHIPCGVVIRSIGYRSVPIASSDQVPFDFKSYMIPNDRGRVLNTKGLYCSGWVKRGPVGVIATTMHDAFETADSILDDISSDRIPSLDNSNNDSLSVIMTTADKQIVSFQDWQKIDVQEICRGESKNKPREKIVSINEMLDVAKS